MAPKQEAFKVSLLMPDREATVTVQADEHIWDAAFAAQIQLPALCHQGYCLTCAGRLENSGDGKGGEVDQSDSRAYFPEDRQAGFVLLCTGKPRSDLRIRTHQAARMREHRKTKGLLAPYSWKEGTV
jgi:ferredoxin